MSMINRTVIENDTVLAPPKYDRRLRQEDACEWSRRSWAANGAVAVVAQRRCERVWQGNMSEILLTVAEAATTLRLHPVTLRALAAAGTVPAVKIGRAWRFVEVDLLAWARAHYRRADAVGDKESTCRSTNVHR